VPQSLTATPSAAGDAPAPPCTLVIFGAGGDLTKRLLTPSLYNLVAAKLLSEKLQILGLDHNDGSDDAWRVNLHDMMSSFAKNVSSESQAAAIDETTWGVLAERMHYLTADFQEPKSYADLEAKLSEFASGGATGNVVFYLAVAARFFGPIIENLGSAGLLEESDGAFRRIIIEKPFGSDLASARELNAKILQHAAEQQVYRIDHFLGKETVQSIMALRFGNGLFEPIWRREYIDSVQITAAETVGVEGRGSFYEQTGALRDMVPNHLFQLAVMTAMEPPISFEAEAVRGEKAKLIGALHAIAPGNAVRGQYAAGTIDGTVMANYRDEKDVAKDSATETYAALKIEIDNWRWSGVPFYLRTGKHLSSRLTTIAVSFKAAPYRIFRDTPVDSLVPNVLTIQIDPVHRVTLDVSAKVPGPTMKLGRVQMGFAYHDFFDEKPNVGYETLIYDCMIGDATLFQRADAIEGGWAAVQPLLDAWTTGEPELYASGSAGPAAADDLLARDGRAWLPLT